MNKSFTCTSESETEELGRRLGLALQTGCLVFLDGTLGAGKTRLVKAVAAGLEIDPDTVTSPTFTIMFPYAGRLHLVHVDAFRLNDLDEAEQLGLDDWLADGCVMMIEWPEKIAAGLPNPDLRVSIKQTGETEREFCMEACSEIGKAVLEQV